MWLCLMGLVDARSGMGGGATHNRDGQGAKNKVDERTLSWVRNRSDGISRIFINKWMSGLGVVLVVGCRAELLLKITNDHFQ